MVALKEKYVAFNKKNHVHFFDFLIENITLEKNVGNLQNHCISLDYIDNFL